MLHVVFYEKLLEDPLKETGKEMLLESILPSGSFEESGLDLLQVP